MKRSPQRSRRKAGTRASAKPAVMVKPAPQASRLAAALGALAHGLPNPWDESTDYFHKFIAVMPAKTPLDAETFRRALGVGARYHIALSSAEDRLTALGNATEAWGEDIAGGFRQLGTVMRATLGALSIAFARGEGVVRVRVWLFGRAEDGTLIGLRSISTET